MRWHILGARPIIGSAVFSLYGRIGNSKWARSHWVAMLSLTPEANSKTSHAYDWPNLIVVFCCSHWSCDFCPFAKLASFVSCFGQDESVDWPVSILSSVRRTSTLEWGISELELQINLHLGITCILTIFIIFCYLLLEPIASMCSLKTVSNACQRKMNSNSWSEKSGSWYWPVATDMCRNHNIVVFYNKVFVQIKGINYTRVSAPSSNHSAPFAEELKSPINVYINNY
jgi:hypothetical protein